MKQILIVEDDPDIGEILEQALHHQGYGTIRAYSGSEALLWLASHQADLILLDLMLPGLSGEKVLEQIRSDPVMVLSAKSSLEDKVSLLQAGAWDYVTKPFEIREVLARVEGILRRSRSFPARLEFEEISMDEKRHTVFVKGEELLLTPTEYALLHVFLENPDQVLSRYQLLEQVNELVEDCTQSSLKTHLSHLRKKLRQASGKEYIGSVWGIGFRLESPED